MNRKPSGKRGKEQYYDRRRKEDEWTKGPPSYVSKPKKKYGGRYDSRDYDYQYIHKDRKQYSRDEMLKLAGKAAIKTEVLEQLTLKYDLVFGEDLKKPIGDIDESKDDRFVESTNDGDTPKLDRRDDYDYNDRDKDRYDRFRDRDRGDRGRPEKDRVDRADRGEREDRGYQRKKEFIRFDALNDSADFDKMDSYLEKKYKQQKDDEDDLPAWATEDYEGEVPAWGKLETNEILKQTENSDKWATMNMKTFNKQEIKEKMAENSGSRSRSEGENEHYENEDDYYTYDKKTHKYKFFEEFEEEEELEREEENAKRKASKTSQDSGTANLGNVEDITSLWRKMKAEEEEESSKNDQFYYEEEVLNANFYEEELMEKRRELGMQPSIGDKPGQRTNDQPNRGNNMKPSLVDDLFGGLNAQVGQKQSSIISPNQMPQFQLNNLNTILGAFASEDQQYSEPSHSTQPGGLISENLNANQSADDIDLIIGPPPSVAKQQDQGLDEKKEKSKREFQEKYFAMDKALNQIVYDALNSRRRHAIDANSTNGVNQISVEKYCANNYKIFSFLMQGDVFSKVWHYKDKVGNVQGPYMSFDMDIWNGEGVYFAKNLAISPNKKDYFPLSMFLERDNAVLEIVQDVVEKLEKGIDQQTQNPMYMKMMYSPPYPGWVPPQLMQGQIPLMPFTKNSNGQVHSQQHGNRKRGADGFSKRGGHGHYQPHHNQGHYKKVDTGYIPTGLSSQQNDPEAQGDMTSNLKDLLGLPNDPAIQIFTSKPPIQESRPTPASQSTTPGQKSLGKNVDDDFPSLSEAFKK